MKLFAPVIACWLLAAAPLMPAMAEDAANPNQQRLTDASARTAEGFASRKQGDETAALGKFLEAADIYDAVLKEWPHDLNALQGRAAVGEEIEPGSGQPFFDKVVKITSAQIAREPQNAELIELRAGAYRGLKRFDEARADYTLAIALRPENKHWPLSLKAMEAEARRAK